jgi:RNA-directed DNA polymerase
MTRANEDEPAQVPLAQQAGDIPERWRWVERSAWTVRMLTTLEQGIEGGKWFRLIDKVYSKKNLLAAFGQVASKDGASGVDHMTVKRFEERLPERIAAIEAQIRQGSYEPQSIRRVHIPKPGTTETRPLGIPTVRDRVVQAAILNVIEPIFERDFAQRSYGFRPGRGCKDALRRVDELLKAGYTHVVDADLKGYFDTIPHGRLMGRLKEKIADGPLLALIEKFLKASVMDGLDEWTPTQGAPQGAVLSPLLSNIYLDPLDHLMASRGYEMVRYADDFVILCRTAEEAAAALELVRAWVLENGLTLHPAKTKIIDAKTEGFDFLGYHFHQDGHKRPREKSLQKFKDTIRAKTRRSNGNSIETIIADVNRTLRGWYGYFKHSVRWIFRWLDGWIRRRLRSILRKYIGLGGISRGGDDHHRWPNAYFERKGLFSLLNAHILECQSSLR